MALVIAEQKIVGTSNVVAQQNCVYEHFDLSGTIANAETGTATLKNTPLLNPAGQPVCIGIPALITPSISGGGSTLTLTSGGAVGAFKGGFIVVCRKS